MTRILVVEDEAIIARDLQVTLQGMGHEVPETRGTGEEAVAAAARLRPDIVLMDIRLAGDMDGTEAAKAIMDQQDAAVVYLTAYADEATLERASGSFPYGYLVKPYDESGLRAAIRTALERRSKDLREADEHSRTLDLLQEGVLLISSAGRVRYANKAARSLGPDAETADAWFGAAWKAVVAAEGTVELGGTRCRLGARRFDGHWSVVLVPAGVEAPEAAADQALRALQERAAQLI